ncbi:hypothetical protein E2C01_069869 [Portunus trituberculatus]|uniref:Uncharacterized protein n=1 Tax=Portunus trituberculatus TaxID=210409 RepID=A0A5B7HSP6_PORTR|nr:hypothetical protein [Portunus trituberculatus]
MVVVTGESVSEYGAVCVASSRSPEECDLNASEVHGRYYLQTHVALSGTRDGCWCLWVIDVGFPAGFLCLFAGFLLLMTTLASEVSVTMSTACPFLS